MSEKLPYLPTSDFLRLVLSDDVTFTDSEFGNENLRRLIALSTDEDVSNRDWAVLLLSQLEFERSEVLEALRNAAKDPEASVRSEAICGLVSLDRELALALVKRELKSEFVQGQIFDAAKELADPSLIGDLEHFQWESDKPFVDSLAEDALVACMNAKKKREPQK